MKYYYALYECLGKTYIVSSQHSLNIGTLVKGETEFGDDILKITLPYSNENIDVNNVISATAISKEEADKYEANKKKEEEFLPTIEESLKEEKLTIKIINVHVMPYANKIVLIYSSDKRIDFRSLVKILNERLSPYRILMHQITMREMARCFNGCGTCGRTLCCRSKTRTTFPTATRRMAKDQNLKQDDSKILGCCNEPKCCLSYEDYFYRNEINCYPPLKTPVTTADGTEWVKEINVISERIILENTDKGRRAVRADQVVLESLPDGTSSWVYHEDAPESDDDDDF